MWFFWFLQISLFFHHIPNYPSVCCRCLVMVSLTSPRWQIRSRMNSFIMFCWLFFLSFLLSLHSYSEHHCCKISCIVNYLQWSPQDNLSLKAFFVFFNYQREFKLWKDEKMHSENLILYFEFNQSNSVLTFNGSL